MKYWSNDFKWNGIGERLQNYNGLCKYKNIVVILMMGVIISLRTIKEILDKRKNIILEIVTK